MAAIREAIGSLTNVRIESVGSLLAPCMVVIGQADEPTKQESLDDATRAAWMLAVIGILVLGLGSVMIIWLFGRMYSRWNGPSEPLPPSGTSHLGIDWHTSKNHHTDDE